MSGSSVALCFEYYTKLDVPNGNNYIIQKNVRVKISYPTQKL